MAAEGSSTIESSVLANTLQSHVDDIRGLLQCGICVRPLYEPFTLACGHTFCYSCLASWFAAGRSKRTCPDCRAPVKTQPAPAYLVRAIVQLFTSRPELLDKEETTAEHSKNHQEESERLDKDKANTDPQSGGLFGGLFKEKPQQLKPVNDNDDGVTRCPHCNWELEDGLNCGGCGYIYQPDSEGTDYSGSDFSDTDFDSMIEGDEDEDEDEDEDDFDGDRMHDVHHGSHPNLPPRFNQRPPDFGPHMFPSFMHSFNPMQSMHSMHFQLHPDLVNQFIRPRNSAPAAALRHRYEQQQYGYDHQEEEYEEYEDDEEGYEESFIDDEEHEGHERREDSQSDRSTVVGSSSQNPPLRAPPIVQYPPVFGPNSTSRPDEIDWRLQDQHELQRLRTGWPSHRITSSSEVGRSSSIHSHIPSDEKEEEDEDEDGDENSDENSDEVSDEDDDELEDEEEDFDVPHLGISRRYQHAVLQSSEEEEEESDDEDSRDFSGPPPRTTGSSVRNAITIDDSDEEPVGPIRRTAQRRQARFSPY
ncbi:uncharacterized protein N7483_007071 [Penicillium malachiteum]|uniref:uncharacterized protein n=1 Tax=Penicillium malachiteum TaxID=1324776 RepID=UPI002548F80F|nr:uncharacterized protein N7483_007071 [Penicillium malachiteum]KAJ5725714.1 hypothetical protein N7483_007071 [Penicillium malachiteum]